MIRVVCIESSCTLAWFTAASIGGCDRLSRLLASPGFDFEAHQVFSEGPPDWPDSVMEKTVSLTMHAQKWPHSWLVTPYTGLGSMHP